MHTSLYIAGLEELGELTPNAPEWRKKKEELQTLWDLMDEDDIREMRRASDPEFYEKQLEMEAHYAAKWKRMKEREEGTYTPPPARAATEHQLPDVVEYSRKYGHLKYEERDAARAAKKVKKEKPDTQEIED